MIIDAWMQHPDPEWIKNPVFESLRRPAWSEASQPIKQPWPRWTGPVLCLVFDNAKRVFRLG
jgi:hypothetical protein